MRKYILFLPFMALLMQSSGWKEIQSHDIDKKFDACLKSKNYTNLGERECLAEALGDWDKELNKQYKCLRERLSAESFANLKSSQLAWIAYRDKEFKFIEARFEGLDGSMYPNMILKEKISIVKNRVLQLQDYCDKQEEGF